MQQTSLNDPAFLSHLQAINDRQSWELAQREGGLQTILFANALMAAEREEEEKYWSERGGCPF
jgi:hypothetical protein